MIPVFTWLLFSTVSTGHPPSWQMQDDLSQLSFTASYDGGGFEGRFDRFEVALTFDPEHPDSAELDVTIQADSINTDNTERDETLATGDWFDFQSHPEAVYRARGFSRLPSGRWGADGTLTLKGIGQPTPIEFDWHRDAQELTISGRARMVGDAEIDRTDFEIGAGDWADPALIGHQVFVEFSLVFTPAAPQATD